jgi:hypothetical protein
MTPKKGDRVWVDYYGRRLYYLVARVNTKTITVESFNSGLRRRVPYSQILEVVPA